MGWGKWNSFIVISLLLAGSLILLNLVFAAGINEVLLLSPGNNTWTSGTNGTIAFVFNYSGENESAVCTLFVMNSSSEFAGANASSASNTTSTTLYSNLTIEEGARRWYVNCTNETETKQSLIFNLTVDWTKPYAKINRPLNSTVNSDSFNFTYNETNLNCSWYSIDDGSNTTSCSITGSEWSGTLSIASDGQHNITVWANDSAGNENSTILLWMRDTAKPPVFVVFPQNNSIYNYSTLNLNVSSNGTEDGWRYNLNGTGNTSFEPNTTITAAENVNNITVYVNDTANNINSTIVYFTVDLTDPAVTIVMPGNTTYPSNPELNFSYVETRPDACWYSVKGGSNSTPASCDANITVLTSDEGSNDVRLCMNDTSGRQGCHQVYYTKDTTKPIITVQTPLNQSYNFSSIWFNVTLNENGDSCFVDYGYGNRSMANSSTMDWSYNNASMNDGSYHAIFYCNDTVGNLNTTDINFTVDTTKPIIYIQSPINQTYDISSVWFNVTLSENGSACLVNYGYSNITMANSSGNWNYNNASMDEGFYQAIFFCNDTVGNGNTTSVSFTIDTVHPYFTAYARNPDPPNEDQAVQVNVTLSETPNTVILEVNNGTKTNYTITTSSGLEYYFTISNTANGNYTAHDQVNYTWFANDSAGNGNWSAQQTFIVANQIPSVSQPSVNNTAPQTNDNISCTGGVINDNDAEDVEQNREYRWYDGANLINGQTFQNLSFAISGLDKGDLINCSIRVYDGYGWSAWVNSSNTATIQNTPPTAPNLGLPANGTRTNDNTPFLNWTSSTDADNDAITYAVEISTSITFASISQANYVLTANNYTASTLTDGLYYWRVWAVTIDANSTVSGVLNITIDTTPPLIFVISPANITYNTSTINLNVSSNEAQAGWKYKLNAAGNVSFDPNTTITAAEGTNNITVYVNDSLGNENTTIRYFTVDLTNPAITIVVPANISYPSNPQLNFSYSEIRPDACWYSLNGSSNITLASCNTNGTVLVSGEGSNNVRLCMNDTSGRQGCHQVYYTKDTIKPTITIQSPLNMSYNLSSLWFNVTLNENADACILYLWWGGNRSMTNSTGNWNYLNASIIESEFEAKFYCNDTTGNMNTTSVNFTVDRTAPNIITIVTPANASYNYNPQLNFTFYEMYPYACWYSLNQSANITLASCATNGTVLATGEGSQNVRLCVNDTAGNTGCSSTRYYTKDTIKPTITITNPPNSTTTSDSFSFAYDHVNCSVYRMDGGSNVTNCSIAALEWNGTLSLSDGPHNVTVWANDNAGNTNSTTRYWRRDVDLPVITIVSPLETYYSTDPQLNFSYVEANPDSCWYSLNGTANVTLASCETNGTIMVSGEGQNNVTLCMNDTSGKFGYDFVNYTKDSSTPIITIILPQNASYNVSSRSFNVTISKVGDTCLVDYGYGNNSMATSNGLSWSHTNSSMNEGSYQAKFFCNDSLENSDTDNVNFTIDLTKPVITIQSPLNQTYNVSSTWFNITLSEPGSLCRVNYGSGNQSMTNSSGNWHYNASLSDGQYNATFYCNDTAGNWNSTNPVFFKMELGIFRR